MSSEHISRCIYQGVDSAMKSGASATDYAAIAKHCFETVGAAPSGGRGLPASGPSAVPHHAPGTCPPWFKWCPSQQACIPLGKTCDSHVCPPWKKWCAAQQACIPNHSACSRCPEGHIWCPVLNRCIRPWDEYCPSVPVPAVPGSKTDAHGCHVDGGYNWCEPMQRCVAPGTPCMQPSGYDEPTAEGLAYVPAGPNAMANEMNLTMPAYANAQRTSQLHSNLEASTWGQSSTADGHWGSMNPMGTSSMNSLDGYSSRSIF